MTAKEIISVIPLIDGKFSPEEAIEIIETMVHNRTRLHDIQMLRRWEGNHQVDTTHLDKQMDEIHLEKNTAKSVISESIQAGYKVEIVGTIQVKLSKPAANKVQLETQQN